MKHCYLCNLPHYRAGEPIWYSGGICECPKPNLDKPPTYQQRPPDVGAREVRTLTESDVRRIVRDELYKVTTP